MTQRRIEEPACQADILQYLLHVRALFLDFHQGIRIGSSSEFCNLDADDENCFGVCGGALKFLLIQLNCLRQENANARDRKGHLQVLLGM